MSRDLASRVCIPMVRPRAARVLTAFGVTWCWIIGQQTPIPDHEWIEYIPAPRSEQ